MAQKIHKVTGVALALVAGLAISLPAVAQNIGDVGRDANGNIFTFTLDANGNGVWTPGRVDTTGNRRTVLAERYIPSIWVDPDGCEHWVMDDGAEGFMTPHVLPNGRPVCNRTGGTTQRSD